MILNYNYLRLVEDLIRDKRVMDYKYDFQLSDYQNLKLKDKIRDAPYSLVEKEKLIKFERKIKVACSFGQDLTQEDLII